MELTVMTINVHSENVVTAEGVEITAEGLTQVRIDPGMAEDQADATELLARLASATGGAHRVGISGVPGSASRP